MKAPDQHTIDRTLNNSASPNEARRVIRWFATPEGNVWLNARMDDDVAGIYPGMEELQVDHAIPSSDMYAYLMNRIRWQRRKRILFRVAAILIPFILFIGQFWYIDKRIDLFDSSQYEEIYVPKGERMQLVFQDGSKATLNAESRIKYPRKFAFSERKVILEGEAFFEISPNKSRPFIVDLNGLDVKVLGTTFDVKAYASDRDIYVSLETGKVQLTSLSKTLASLKPGEQAVYNRFSKVCKISKQKNITRTSAWKNNVVVFDNTSLSEVITVLSRQFNVEFLVSDSTVLNYNYTLTSSKTQIGQVLKELEKIAPVRFVQQEGEITVRMK